MNKNLQKITGWRKHSVKGITLLAALFLLSSTVVSAQEVTPTYYYKTVRNGEWKNAVIWERSETFDGVYLGISSDDQLPNSTNSKQVTIIDDHEITITGGSGTATTNLFIDQLVVDGTLIIDPNVFVNIVNDSEAPELDLIINGHLINNGYLSLAATEDENGSIVTASAEVKGTITSKTGKYNSSKDNLRFTDGSVYNHTALTAEFPLPLATWHVKSTINITGMVNTDFGGTTLVNANQVFGDFIWDTPNFTSSGIVSFNIDPVKIQGDFKVISTGTRIINLLGDLQVDNNFLIAGPGTLRLTTGGSGSVRAVTVNGNVEVTGGTLNLISGSAGTSTLNVLGDFKYTGGTITKNSITPGSAGNINFKGTNNQIATINKEFTGPINFSIASGSALNLGVTSFIASTISGGNFIVQDGGTVKVGDVDGINSTVGNIRIPQTYNDNSKIAFNGTAAQVLGVNFPATASINVEVDNAAGVTMDKDLTIATSRTLNLKTGSLNIGGFTLTLDGNVTGPAGLGTTVASNITINGTGPLGTLNFTAATPVLRNFIVNRSDAGTVTMGTSIGIVGNLDLSDGSLIIDNTILGLYGTANHTAGALSGNDNTIILVGVEPGPATGLPETGTINLNFTAEGNTINTLNLGTLATNSEVNLNSNLNIQEALILQEGNLNNTGSGELTLLDNSTAYLTNGIINFPPVSDGAYNLVYYAGRDFKVPGEEFPNGSTIRNVTIGGDDGEEIFSLNGARTVRGNFTIFNGRFSQGIYALSVQGDFTATANGIYSVGTNLNSRVILNGNIPQTITGNLSFQNLDIANTAADITLNNSIVVRNILTFTSGKLQTGSNQVQLGATNTTGSMTGESEVSHLVGNVKISRALITAGVKQSFGDIGIEMLPIDTAPGTITILRNTGTPITAATGSSPSIERVFDITGPVSGQDITMTFKYLDAELNGNDETDLRMYKSTDPRQWIEQSKEQPSRYSRDATLNFVTLTGVDGFSRWTLAQPVQVLPVELTSFTAKKKGKTVELNWVTAMEADNKGFEVQVSMDAKNYRVIGFVASKNGNSRLAQQYAFTDSEKRKDGGTFYYRLKQIDNNGTEKFYGPVSVSFDREALAISAHPNPTSGAVKIQYEAEANKEVTVTVVDVHGKTVFTKQVAAERGHNTLDIDLGNQANGMYFLIVTSASGMQQLKLIKK